MQCHMFRIVKEGGGTIWVELGPRRDTRFDVTMALGADLQFLRLVCYVKPALGLPL